MTDLNDYYELPRYRSHKVVRAGKIVRILQTRFSGSVRLMLEVPNGEDEPVQRFPMDTDPGWFVRYKGHDADLGYFVVYEDGYQSWSPTEAFEGGYVPDTEDEGKTTGAPLTISGCHLEDNGGDELTAVAEALGRNAQALEVLAEKVRGRTAPMIQIIRDDDE